jgi:hypothetical protein
MPGRNTQRKKKESNLRWEVEKTGWDESNMVKAGKLKRSLGVQPFLEPTHRTLEHLEVTAFPAGW